MAELAFPGAIAVWSSNRPRFDTCRIPLHVEGLVLARDFLDHGDDRISRNHARVTVRGEQIVIEDLRSRNGTYVAGEAIAAATPELPAIARVGRTVFVLVADVRPYEHVPLSRRGSLVVGGTLDKTCRELDTAVLDEDNVALVGAHSVGRELARSYAKARGGETITFDPSIQAIPLERLLASVSPLHTVILELSAALGERDLATVATWLETDVRFVTIASSPLGLLDMPRLLTTRVIEIPTLRLDELPTTLYDTFAELAPHAAIHATVIEAALLNVRELTEDRLLRRFRDSVTAWLATGEQMFRPHHFDLERAPPDWCQYGVPMRR